MYTILLGYCHNASKWFCGPLILSHLSRISLGEQALLSEGSVTLMQGKRKIHLWKNNIWRCCMVLSWGMLLHLNVPLPRKKMSTLATTVEITVYRVACVHALLVRNIFVLVHCQLTALSEERFCKHSLTVHIWLAKSSYCADRTF